MHRTGLAQNQVKNWSENERKKADKRGDYVSERNNGMRKGTSRAAVRMWREYKKDPERCYQQLASKEMSLVTGESLVNGQDDGKEYDDEDSMDE